jgi:hypothetical protein
MFFDAAMVWAGKDDDTFPKVEFEYCQVFTAIPKGAI